MLPLVWVKQISSRIGLYRASSGIRTNRSYSVGYNQFVGINFVCADFGSYCCMVPN